MWPPLVDFGARLADELGHPVQINAYITPPQSQGFAPHYDVHDVFVLQVSGRKHWIVHPPVVDDPLDNQPFGNFRAEIAERVTDPPLIDTVLEPGDALYLPRGTIHSAKALGDTSIHLTVGVHPLTRYQLVRFLLDAVQDDPELRASLPMGADLADPDVLSPHLAATVAALHAALERVPAARIAERLGTNLMQRTRPEPIGPLAQLAAADALASDTPLRRRGALRLRVIADGDEGLKIVLLDRTIELPPGASDAVEARRRRARLHAGGAARPRTRGAADPDPPAPARGCPGAGVRERCATRADSRGDPMLGTAFPAARLLLVEQPLPWGSEGLRTSRFDPGTAWRSRLGPGPKASASRPSALQDAAGIACAGGGRSSTRATSRGSLRWGTFDGGRRAARAAARRLGGRAGPGPALPRLHPRQARPVLRSARPRRSPWRWRPSAPVRSGRPVIWAAAGSLRRCWCSRSGSCTGASRLRPRPSS